MSAPSDAAESTPQSHWPLVISAALIAAVALAYFLIPSFRDFVDEAWQTLTSDDEQKIRRWVEQFGIWGPLLIVVVMTVQMFLIVVPTWALMAVTVLAYGVFWGALLSIVSVAVASSVGYFVGRYFGDATVARLVGPSTLSKVDAAVHRHGMTSVILIRLAPFLSNDAVSFVAGVLRMGYWRFMAATLLGITPLAALIAWFGKDWQQLKMGLIWISAGLLLAYGTYIVWSWRRSDQGPSEEQG